ncbi:sugar phosphate isomerase/epimerase family protein [Ideonella livida]|uniref:TIM barrel protein n=1 Tax=Ideonella livida TaxID=2707176 RepID=A0A7C9TJX5_9BURK|nr:TIM barrel protein [Ideonella livida]NDY92058.1 TIM barrel protein [Ideonella livida]
MTQRITSAPCCWGVDDVRNPHLPPWTKVLDEAAAAGYAGLELGPWGYLPQDPTRLGAELRQRGLHIVAGTIFDDLVSPENLEKLRTQADQICALLKQLPAPPADAGKAHPAPYLVLIDWGSLARDLAAGRSAQAPRLAEADWRRMVEHIRTLARLARDRHGVRAVIHPHAGGFIEFDDEIRRLVAEVPHDEAGLCLDTGHLFYSGMNPQAWLREHAARLDYVHFKDVNAERLARILAGEPVRFFDACAQGVMCPMGQGALDYPAIRQTLLDIGYQGAITVEQERDPRHADTSLRDVRASREYLRGIGFA